MSISNSVGFLVFLAALVILGTMSFSLASASSIESRAALLSSLVTSLTLLVLVWERLREFALRKLEYLNKRALSPVLKIAAQGFLGYYFGQAETFRKATKLLKRRGRYLGIHLYPKSVIPLLEKSAEHIDRYTEYEKKFSEKWAPNFLMRNLLIALDLMPRSNESAPEIEKYKVMADSLAGETKNFVELCRNLGTLMTTVKEKLGDFFEENELEMAEETGLATYYRALY